MMNRRTLIAATGGAAALAAAAGSQAQPIDVAAAAIAPESLAPAPNNPFAARAFIYTIVTPDMDASIRWYRDVMGNDLIARGTLQGAVPTVRGAGKAGRAYALLSHRDQVVRQRGVIRLLEAAPGAKANRPRPHSNITDPGLASIECHPSDWQAAFQKIAAAKAEIIAPPLYYFGGKAEAPTTYSIMFSCFGPAGEQLFISSHPAQVKTFPGLYGPFVSSTVMCLDRWPLWDFYEAVFGLKPAYDKYVGEETLNYRPVNTAIGAPQGTYFQFGGMGQDLTMEWWEYRQWRPTPTPPYPTDLDRTGLAMTTILVDDAEVVRARVKAAGIPILGEGVLPTPMKVEGGFYVRGAVGELIEVVGRG